MIQVNQKNNIFVLNISIILTEKGLVTRKHKKSKFIFISVRTIKIFFGSEKYIKEILIFFLYNKYNYNINAINKNDQLAINNPRLCLYYKGDWQTIKYQILYIILINYYIIIY